MFAAEIRRKRVDRMRECRHWRWHLDERFVKNNGEKHYLWRAVDQEGEVLETFGYDSGDHGIFDFGVGNAVHLLGVTSLVGLATDIKIF